MSNEAPPLQKPEGKTIIGLTGNIATGKSVVRRMLQHLGAFGIDADGLTHLAMAKGAPAYRPIVQTFGRYVLNDEGQINRQRLGGIVFNDPEALKMLEAIIHPIVRQAIAALIERSPQDVIVIEAIKLMEGSLSGFCDQIWVADAPQDIRIARLIDKRQMAPKDAKRRVEVQNPQAEKTKQADVVINNGLSYEHTWEQVRTAWIALFGAPTSEAKTAAQDNAMVIRRATPSDARQIAAFLNDLDPSLDLSRSDVIGLFGQRAYFIALSGEDVKAIAGWQIENLIVSINELQFANSTNAAEVVAPLLSQLEEDAKTLQAEAALLFVNKDIYTDLENHFKALSYNALKPSEIRISAWREAAKEFAEDTEVCLLKKLREKRVLRPV